MKRADCLVTSDTFRTQQETSRDGSDHLKGTLRPVECTSRSHNQGAPPEKACFCEQNLCMSNDSSGHEEVPPIRKGRESAPKYLR